MLTRRGWTFPEKLKRPTIEQAEKAGLCKGCVAYKPDQPLPIRGVCHATLSGEAGKVCVKKDAGRLFLDANQKRYSTWTPEKGLPK